MVTIGVSLVSYLLFNHVSRATHETSGDLPQLTSSEWTQKSLDPAILHRGGTQFKLRCSRCHGYNGEGGHMAPALRDSSALKTKGDTNAMVSIIWYGMPEAGMPGWGHRLLPADIVALTVYIKSLQEESKP